MLPRRIPLFLLLACALRTSGVESGPLLCDWADAAPALDGATTDAAWSGARKIEVGEGATLQLKWDREAMFLRAEIPDRTDTPAWTLWLRPSDQHTGRYEFRIPAAGPVAVRLHPGEESRRGRGGMSRDGFRTEARTLVTAGTRVVEVRIPWTDLAACGGRPAPGETWSAAFAPSAGTDPVGELETRLVPLTFAGPAPLPRGPWTGGRLLASPEPSTGFRVTPAWPGLDARSLVALAASPDRAWLWFVDQSGGRGGAMRLGRLRADGDGRDSEVLLATDDIVTSLVFHPKYSENGYVYLGTNGPRGERPRFSRVVRYTVRDGRPDPATRTVIIEWPSDGHNGGGLAFGGDGRLFVTSGDGTSDGDRDRVGQDPRTLRSKILRIDVDLPSPGKHYAVPADNPFAADARFAPETWAYGLRNPWRLTYDATSDQLWAGENGQDAWEYAHLVRRGANYGWSVFEGSHPFGRTRAAGPTPISPPTLEFPHAEFRSLSGGIVYRGRALPELVGAYVFGDFGTGRLWAARHDGTKLAWLRELVDTPLSITHVTADADGELLIADYGFERARTGPRGGIFRLARSVPDPAAAAQPFPRRLSETGLFADTARLDPATGVIPYTINAPGWHDGARGVHHLALPTGKTIEVGGQKAWDAPDGTVLAQTLLLDGRRLETRLLVRQQEDWASYSFRWDDTQRDATLVEKGGVDLTLTDGRPWRIPSRAECMMCHSREANFALTLNEPQLNAGDQLLRWEARGLLQVDLAQYERRRPRAGGGAGFFGRRGGGPMAGQRAPVVSGLLPAAPARLDRYAPPADAAASLEARARSYLAVNCSSCHSPSGGGNSAMNFEWRVSANQMQAINEPPQHGDFGIPDARVIAPGAAAHSVLVPRMGMRGPGQMPPVATRLSDTAGLRVLIEWIQSLPP